MTEATKRPLTVQEWLDPARRAECFNDMLAALRDVEKALLHDAAPPFDPRGDNRIYQLDGGILGNALNKVRAAITKAEAGA